MEISPSHLSLQNFLAPFTVNFYRTDDFSVYTTNLPREKHILGNSYTPRPKRTNLTLLTRLKRLARKTIGFSKSEATYDKVVGPFIKREYYY